MGLHKYILYDIISIVKGTGSRPGHSRASALRIIFLIFSLCLFSQAWAQGNPIDKALENGMARLAPNDAPFGKNPDGTPYWPSSYPGFIQSSPPAVSSAQPAVISANELRSSNQKGDTRTVEKMIMYLNVYNANAKLDPARTRPLISASFEPDPASIILADTTREAGTQTPEATVQKLQKIYLIDIERHGRCVSEGKDEKALEIALKWQTIARLFPDRISEITLNVATRHGAASFEGWINFVVSKDWQIARLQGLPPQISTPAQTTSAPSSPSASVQVYDNKNSKWVEAGQLIYDAMAEQGSGKYGPSPGLYFRAGGTVGPTP